MAKATGPVPKRDSERIRRNKDEPAVETVPVIGRVEQPPLALDDPHPIIIDLYHSLAESAQAQYYEPSDWQFARFTLHFANQLIQSGRPSSQMLAAINASLTELLVSEGSRRRVRLEVEREQAGNGDVLDVAAMFRERMQQADAT